MYIDIVLVLHRSHIISFISFMPFSEQLYLYHLFALILINYFPLYLNIYICPYSLFFRYLTSPFWDFFCLWIPMPFPLSLGGGGIFAFVFCIHFCRTHHAPQRNDVHIAAHSVHHKVMYIPVSEVMYMPVSVYIRSHRSKSKGRREP